MAYYLAGEHPIKGDIVRSFDPVEEPPGHLVKNSEHYLDLQYIADRVKRSKKSSKNLVR